MLNKFKYKNIINFFIELIHRRTTYLILCFLIGLMLGYWLGLIKLHEIVIKKLDFQSEFAIIWSTKKISSFRNAINSFVPDKSFLSDIIAFQGAVIAIAYPLSLEIVSRISERYKSSILINKFNNEWQVKLLPYLLIVDVLIAILLNFFYVDELASFLARVLSWFTIILFIISTFVLIHFFTTLKKYIADPKFLLDQFLTNAKELIKLKSSRKFSKVTLSKRQNELVSAFEGLGDLLSYEFSRKRSDEYLIQALEEMRLVIQQFLDLSATNPEEFERLLLPPDFHERYKDRQQDAQLLLQVSPKDYLVPFTSAISQFTQIHEVAIASRNLEVGKIALFNFIQLLREMTHRDGNSIFAEQILRSFADIRRKAVINGDMESAYTASVSWYTNIVHNSILGKFEISYLDLFDKYFFRGIQFLVSQGLTEVYKSLISYLTNGLYLESRDLKNPDDYKRAVKTAAHDYFELNEKYDLDYRFQMLSSLYIEAISFTDFKKFLDNVESILSIEELKIFTSEPQQSKLVEQITNSLSVLIRQRDLEGLILATGAYCLFQERFDYIKYMWEFNQPPDSDSTWVNSNIVPSSLEAVVAQYARRFHFETKFSMYWDDHHGCKVYFDQYFLLLLIRVVHKPDQTPEELQKSIDSFRLPPHTNINFLHDLKISQEYYIKLSDKILQNHLLIREIGLDSNRIKLFIESFLIPFIGSLPQKIDAYFSHLIRIKRISKQKADSFRSELFQAFCKNAQIRDILVSYSLYEDSSGSSSDVDRGQIAINRTFNKEAFFQDWHVHYMSIGNNFGQGIAAQEDGYLLEKLIEWSKEIDTEDFNDTLDTLKDRINNVFMVTNVLVWNEFFEDKGEFKPKWMNQELVSKNAANSLSGWYKFSDHSIPIYKLYSKLDREFVLILERCKLGKLVQYPPQEGWRPKSKVDAKSRLEYFHIGITAFSEDPVLMKSFLDTPPDWLEETQEGVGRREYLESHVLFELSESFELLKDEQFEGYVLTLPSTSNK